MPNKLQHCVKSSCLLAHPAPALSAAAELRSSSQAVRPPLQQSADVTARMLNLSTAAGCSLPKRWLLRCHSCSCREAALLLTMHMRRMQGHHVTEAPGQSSGGGTRPTMRAQRKDTQPAAIEKGSKSSTLAFEDFNPYYKVDNRPAQHAYAPYMHAMAREAARFEVRGSGGWLISSHEQHLRGKAHQLRCSRGVLHGRVPADRSSCSCLR